MIKRNKKTVATLLIVIVTIALFVAFMYVKVSNGKTIPQYSGILFSILPALAVNAIWNPDEKNKK